MERSGLDSMGVNQKQVKKETFMERFVSGMEKVMRFIPSPIKIFLWLFLIISVIACVVSLSGAVFVNPADGSDIFVRNPISKEGLQWFLNSFMGNITGYMTLGPVFVMMLGVGTCEQTGAMGTLMRTVTNSVSDKLVPLTICLIGVMGNAMGNSSIFVLTPLAGFAYLALGRSPLWGMVTAYVANISGLSANFVLAEADVIVTGITNMALESANIDIQLDVASNWYFMSVSAVVMTLTSYFISEKVINKAFAPPSPELIKEIGADTTVVTPEQRKGLIRGLIAVVVYILLFVAGAMTGVLTDEEGTISPILNNLPVVFSFGFILMAVIYGTTVGKISEIDDVIKMMMKSIQRLSRYLVLIVFISQFTALLSWTKLTSALAASGSAFLQSANVSPLALLLIFILLCCLVNIVITSTNAMYNIFAPVAVPILTHMGWHPALVQAAFRIADSCTNIMSPVSSFLYMMLDLGRETFLADEKDCSVAKWMSCLIPASLIMSVVWVVLLLVWILLDLPLGPGGAVYVG